MTASLITKWFPWEQVGAESLRETGVHGMSPVNYMHVWWARRPLVTSRAAILGTLLPAWEGSSDPVQRFELQRSIERILGGRPPESCEWHDLAPWVLPIVEEYVKYMARGGPKLNRVDFECYARSALIMALDRYWPVSEEAIRTGMDVVSMAACETWDAWAQVMSEQIEPTTTSQTHSQEGLFS